MFALSHSLGTYSALLRQSDYADWEQYIKTLLVKIPLSIEVRTRHFLTVNHSTILMKQIWQNDWLGRVHTRSIVQDSAVLILFTYTSGREGEYFESECRRGSGRGLLYKVGILGHSTESSGKDRVDLGAMLMSI